MSVGGVGLAGRAALLASSSLALSLTSGPALAAAVVVNAETAPATPVAAAAAAEAAPEADPDVRIVVIGNRVIIASLQDVPVEREYGSDEVASYAVSTVEELLAEIKRENGDDDAAVLVNGRPVRNMDDVADLPVEAIARIEALPRGAAQRVNGAAGQRAYNVVLLPSVESLTLTASREDATEGGWHNWRGEALATWIKGMDRLNLTLRGADSGNLFENERAGFIPRPEFTPFSALGNVQPGSGAQVDPVLSALVGQTVTVVALPAGNMRPTQAQLVAGANQINPSGTGAFRTLRGASRNYELALAGNKQLSEWLSFSGSGRLGWNRGGSFSGLPSARFFVPASNPFTPFSTNVFIALNDPKRPLRSRNRFDSASLSGTFNADIGDWLATLTARYDRRQSEFESAFTGTFAPGATTIATANPFDGSLAATIPLAMRLSTSDNTIYQLSADVEGPLLALWAGPLRLRGGASASWLDFDSDDGTTAQSFKRHEYLIKGGVTVPLTSRSTGFLPQFGDSEIAADIGTTDLGKYGTLDRYSLAFNWQVTEWLRFVANENKDEFALAPELFSSPQVITPNVPFFDPVTGQTVDVTTISGGAGALQNQSFRTRNLSLTANPMRKYNVQLNANYTITDIDNQIGALPPPSSAVVAAFPDRFIRDASGTLVTVDQRSVNFAKQHTRQLRLGVGFNVPLRAAQTIKPAPGRPLSEQRRIPGLSLQVNASRTIVFENTTVIRPGLPAVNLLKGGAIGIGGGLSRYSSDLSLALTQGRSGLRINARRRGESFLVIGTLAAPDLLTFGQLTTADLKAFVDLGEQFRGAKWAKDTRLTFGVTNFFDNRQRVVNNARFTPQAYQPIYRDPIGRTVSLELRKVF